MFLDMFLRCVLVGHEMQQIKQDLLIKTLLQRVIFGQMPPTVPFVTARIKETIKTIPLLRSSSSHLATEM